MKTIIDTICNQLIGESTDLMKVQVKKMIEHLDYKVLEDRVEKRFTAIIKNIPN